MQLDIEFRAFIPGNITERTETLKWLLLRWHKTSHNHLVICSSTISPLIWVWGLEILVSVENRQNNIIEIRMPWQLSRKCMNTGMYPTNIRGMLKSCQGHWKISTLNRDVPVEEVDVSNSLFLMSISLLFIHHKRNRSTLNVTTRQFKSGTIPS